ncbi:AHH domain-containing protein [Qipengyuania sp. XHP0211]|uniref:AHH domain-containing protein n=1 Tax=Qipengyuania sp. XHP0211 TaxID=3038079 RepID=UPI00241F2EB1|nr:AHH domain-containing protein [Qipengyuania sp. XHP0211]MDG5751403.1 AHH domain-containing protein [Qipengyuania sp. XHP0211]
MGTPTYGRAMQRHHLLPCQLLSFPCFGRLFDKLGLWRISFDDFRDNGLPLPSREEAAVRLAMPLHRGPHRDYNEMVIEKVGRIEQSWSRSRRWSDDARHFDALNRLARLQDRLRLNLLDQRRAPRLSTKDPRRSAPDFADLDALAEDLWREA